MFEQLSDVVGAVQNSKLCTKESSGSNSLFIKVSRKMTFSLITVFDMN
jgi:hypothetical protein